VRRLGEREPQEPIQPALGGETGPGGEQDTEVGRSRHQTLVVDRSHEGVSGHHLDIVEIDPLGSCVVVVHGDNGVTIDGVPHAAGARETWRPGQKLVLGDASPSARPCVLELAPPQGD
jgi:pSer/pThr/pTyr-binding forkhead associated (FHA) protein